MTLLLSLLAVWAILLVVFGEADNGWPNSIVTVLAMVGLYFILENPPELPSLTLIGVLLGGYLLLGLGYSLLRWNHFNGAVAKVFYAEGENAAIRRFRVHTIPPKPYDSKGRITNWVLWWPASILNVLVMKLVFIADWVGPYLVGFYDRISSHHFKRERDDG